MALGYPLYAYGMVLTQSFNGAGDTWTPTWLNLFCFWMFEIPLAWALAGPAGLGPTGVFWAIMAAFSLLALVERGAVPTGPLEDPRGLIVSAPSEIPRR